MAFFLTLEGNVMFEAIKVVCPPLRVHLPHNILFQWSYSSLPLATRFASVPLSLISTRIPRRQLIGVRARFHSLRPSLCGTDKQTPPAFKYTCLNWANNEIRLIKILPQENLHNSSDGEPVSCSIQNVSLNSKPEYVALSYAWGDNTRSQPLFLNGKLTYITVSLDKALRQLRSLRDSDKGVGARAVWVDAVCINQDDEVEKTWQVQQMGRIFHGAYHAIVWLGPAGDSSSVAMETLQQIGHSIRAGHEPVDNPALELFTRLSETPESFGPALNALLSRPWWKRVWVVQEFAVAKDTVFLCGDTRLWWQFAYDALDALDKHKRILGNKTFAGMIGVKEYHRSMAELAVISSTLRLFKIRSDLNDKKKMFSLWDLLKLKDDGMQASDHRDIIYAITGIAKDAQQEHLYPDYTKRVQDVFTQVAKTFLVQGRLRLLWLCTQPRNLVKLPSWVPDWSSTWRNDYRYFSTDGTYGSFDKIFAASGESRPVVSFSANAQNALLRLGGCRFDAVEHTGSAFDVGDFLKTKRLDFHHIHLGIAERFREISNLQSRNIICKEGERDAIIRTAVSDVEPTWSPDIRFTYSRSSSCSLRQLYSRYVSNLEEWDLDNTNDMLPSKLDILFRHHGRRPFLTTKGHLGLGPAALKRGDTVAIIFGAELPLIFRENGEGQHLLIGEAFVDRIMDGEVLEMNIQSTTFDIV
jgi:hypothetical protein